jgi:anti-anti-sigma factor
MSISYRDVGELRTIMLAGRMDVGGWDAVAAQLVELTQAQSKVVLDLSALPMLASIGIRAISVSAKDVAARGGKMVLVADSTSTVMSTLKLTGLEQLVPVFRHARDAERAVAT